MMSKRLDLRLVVNSRRGASSLAICPRQFATGHDSEADDDDEDDAEDDERAEEAWFFATPPPVFFAGKHSRSYAFTG